MHVDVLHFAIVVCVEIILRQMALVILWCAIL